MRTEIKTETVSERVRSEREQSTAEEREAGPSDGDPRFAISERFVNAMGRPFRRGGAEFDVRRMLFGFLRRFID
jgi:hypothetical protein